MRVYALTIATALFVFGAASLAQAAEGAQASGIEHLSTGRSVAQSTKKCFKLSEACLYDEVNEKGLRDCRQYLATCRSE